MKVLRVVPALLLAHICLSVPSCSWNNLQMPLFPKWGSEEPETPRASASLQLTEQGKMLLESGRVDDAITLLERSMGLDPANGLNYYYLSEAWILKGNLVQAEEFNRLAKLYLKDDPDWRSRAAEQQRQVRKLKEWPLERN